MLTHWPSLLVHCDWSIDKRRRWMASARLVDGIYLASEPEPAGNLNQENTAEKPLFNRIHKQRGEASALIGFDFPIGLPNTYAGKVGARQFPAFLANLESESQLFKVCHAKDEISLNRPFYPQAPGGKQLAHLTRALGLEPDQLLRLCDHSQPNRAAAAALFWTLGAKQVGKAAIVGWRDVLAPALRKEEIQIWPFHGKLDSLLKPNKTVVAETYPAHYYSGIFGALHGPKTSQKARAEAAPEILKWVSDRANPIELSNNLRNEIQAGFHQGDDAFDAAIGLFGMIDALQNWNPAFEPEDHAIRNIEGWIFGQSTVEPRQARATLSPCRPKPIMLT